MPSSPAAEKPDNARCARCGGGFHCGARDIDACACTGIALDAQTLAMLRERYRGCLCLACLQDVATAPQAVSTGQLAQ